MKKRNGWRSILALAALAFLAWLVLATAWSTPSAAGARRAGTLVYAQTGDPVTLDSVRASGEPASFAINQIFDHLVHIGPDGSHLPALATSWEGSKDLKTYSFKLRRGAKFHDGTPFNAAAVKFNYERFVDKNVSAMVAQYDIIDRIETPDDHTVVFHLKRPSVSFVEEQISEWRGVINSPTAINKSGKGYATRPVGTGPWKFVEWIPDDRITLERNPDYWGGAPLLEKLVIRSVPDPQTTFLEIQRGSVHMAYKLQPEHMVKLKESRDIVIQAAPSLTVRGFWFNVTRPPFNDIKVRQAVSHAVDTDTMVKALLGDMAVRSKGPVYVSSPALLPTLKEPEYDPEKAKRLLAQAGWKPGSDGILAKEGKRFSISILTGAGLLMKGKEQCEFLQQNLANVGIGAKIEELEYAAFLKKRFEKQNDIIMFGTGPRTPDPSLTVLDINLASKGRLNVSGYSNPELDKILVQARSISSMDERKKLYYKAQEMAMNEYVGIYTYNDQEQIAIRREVKDYRHSAIGRNNLFDKVSLGN